MIVKQIINLRLTIHVTNSNPRYVPDNLLTDDLNQIK